MDFDLNQVFEILDENGEGRIQLRRFIDIASNYYSDAEVKIKRFSNEKSKRDFSFFSNSHELPKR